MLQQVIRERRADRPRVRPYAPYVIGHDPGTSDDGMADDVHNAMAAMSNVVACMRSVAYEVEYEDTAMAMQGFALIQATPPADEALEGWSVNGFVAGDLIAGLNAGRDMGVEWRDVVEFAIALIRAARKR